MNPANPHLVSIATWQVTAPSNLALRTCLERTADRLSIVYDVEWMSRSTSNAHVPSIDGWASKLIVQGPGTNECHGLISPDEPPAALLFWLVLQWESQQHPDEGVTVYLQDEALNRIFSTKDARPLLIQSGSVISDILEKAVQLGICSPADLSVGRKPSIRTDLWI